ncbi:E3 ubiquitin-protein ligase Hakai isoform B [Glycine soja]|uniref:E3 ubiquitin-protein ligase Hakai isoform B n=1 Tax=Glycine soja TaxID=3848 RepID=A0A445JWP9_GLYSO|nr:E3 ubiquitin-protein ligase Hakai isoform B [Glycine soja]|eukprot:XP_006583618.1 E3 ubiquitin-protein ligase Hakai isoform X2 [Glycine max]
MVLQSPCEHAFCLDCARSDSMCYLCDDRIQKIQTIKMMEGILICAAPHCLKSFLKKADFESHIQDSHASLLRPNADKEDGNESEAQSVRQSTASDSTARGPQRPVFSPGSNSQQHDLEEKSRRQTPREQPPSRQTMQPKPPYYSQQQHPSDTMSGSVGGGQQGFHQQSFDIQHPPQESSQFADRQQAVGPETPFPEYPTMHPAQPSNVPSLVTSNPMLNPPMPFGYPPYPNERAQPFYGAPYDMPRQDSGSDIGGDQSSLLGFPQGVPSGPNFPGNYLQPWNSGMGGVPFEQAQGGMVVDPREGKGILAPQPMPLPPPPPPPSHMSHGKQNYYSGEVGHDGQGYGWQHDNRDNFGNQV